MKMKESVKKTIYYKDEVNDEFSGIARNRRTIDETYCYIHSGLGWRIVASFVYWVLALPIAFLYMKLKFGLKIENKEVLKPYQKEGYFLYGNHTQVPGDGFIQALVSYPKKNYVVVNADNVSLRGTEQLMLMIGAMPLPTTIRGYRNFMEALDQRCQAGIPIVIYPEAHIWPFYTRIRNFPQTSFQYPIREGKPAFSFTTVYRKRKIRKTPKIVVKVDGPFWAEGNLPMKLAAKRLRDQVFDTMVVRAEESDCEYIKYVYSPET